MAELIAVGSLIGAKVVAAGAAAGSWIMANPMAATMVALGAATGTVGMMGSIASAKAQRAQGESAAKQGMLQIEGERAQAAIEAADRQRQLARVLASQNAIFGASGFQMNSGTFDTFAADSLSEATREQSRATTYSGVRQGLMQMQVNDTLSSSAANARATTIGGITQFGSSLISTGLNLANTGSIPKAAPKKAATPVSP
jgi:hypothetical protein